jgi:hypothetical protein
MIDDALTPDCRSSIKNCGTVMPLAFRSQIWTLTTAIRSTAIFSVAICLENTAICQYSVMNLSADFSKTVKSSTRHFTSRGPLFEASYIFDVRLYKFKTNTRRIVWA